MAAIAPILIFVGLSMIENVAKIDWKDMLMAIPAFFIIVMMPLSYSITTGIQFGFILYVVVNLVNKKGKEVSPIIYILSLLFIFSFTCNPKLFKSWFATSITSASALGLLEP